MTSIYAFAREMGFKVILDAYAVLYHAENEGSDSASVASHRSDRQRFLSRHGAAVIGGDPFFSPLLSRTRADMSLLHPDETPSELPWRTTPIVVPGRANRSRSLRKDPASPSQASVMPLGKGASADHRTAAAFREGARPR